MTIQGTWRRSWTIFPATSAGYISKVRPSDNLPALHRLSRLKSGCILGMSCAGAWQAACWSWLMFCNTSKSIERRGSKDFACKGARIFMLMMLPELTSSPISAAVDCAPERLTHPLHVCLTQMRWFSFQFLMQQLGEELADAQHCGAARAGSAAQAAQAGQAATRACPGAPAAAVTCCFALYGSDHGRRVQDSWVKSVSREVFVVASGWLVAHAFPS